MQPTKIKLRRWPEPLKTIGVAFFLAIKATAIGFGVLYFKKFDAGWVWHSGRDQCNGNVSDYVNPYSVILNFLPVQKKNIRHQDGKRINSALNIIDGTVPKRRAGYMVSQHFLPWSLSGYDFG